MPRPSEYSESYIPNLLQQASEGKTIAEFAAGIGKCKKTIYNWAKEHPEWQQALDDAHTLWEAWMDRMGRRAIEGLTVVDETTGKKKKIAYPMNTAVYIFLRKAKLGERDIEKVEGTDNNNSQLLNKIKDMLPV